MASKYNAIKLVIEPRMAKEMLKKRRPNRSIRMALLNRLINDIKSGNWHLTGETIIFDDEGYLIDGQHRLRACVEAAMPIISYVVLGGIDKDAQLYTDIGAARTPGDALHMMGHADANVLAATLRWIHRYHTGTMRYKAQILSRAELIASLSKYEHLPKSIFYGRRTLKFMTLSMGTALHYLMAEKDRSLANQFFTELAEGSDDRNSPIFVLREKLITYGRRAAKHPEHYLAAWTIKAWNLLRDGRKAKIIIWQPEAPSKMEPFPVIK